MNVKGDTFYYVKKDGVYKKKMNGGNEKVIYNKAVEPTKSYLYVVEGDMYIYMDNGIMMIVGGESCYVVFDLEIVDDV
ncbi:hypothetical protein OFN37_32865, partial [Escherichia coli]|nr:hypothetical protein [Escherichia coli]